MELAATDAREHERWRARLAGFDIPEDAGTPKGDAWARALALRDRERTKRR